jgi:PucR C-terminal helix-turn-helix domain/GGDEF-like domain
MHQYVAVVPATTPMELGDSAREIARVLRASLPDLIEKVVDCIRSEIPSYATEDFVPVDAMRTSLSHNINYILVGLEGAGEKDTCAPVATGRDRAARGAPLVDLLSSYQVGFAVVWAAMVEAARSLPTVPADAIVDLAGFMFDLQNEYSNAAVGAYRDEAQQLIRSSERERAALVELIVSEQVAKGTLWEAAQTLRLPLNGSFLVVAAEVDEAGRDPLPRAESALAVLGVSSVWRLETDMSVGVLSLPDRARVEGVLKVLHRQAATRVGVSPFFGELRQAAWALRLARLALDAEQEKTGVNQFEDSPLSVLVASAPHAALETARVVLGGLLELPLDDRDLLLGTLEAWLDVSGSANAASARLFCHPNTVRYRLRRIEAATQRSLSDPRDLAELVTAARAWSQLPHPS